VTVVVLGINLLMFAALVFNFLFKAWQKKKLSTELKGVVADLKAATAHPHSVLPFPGAAHPKRSSKVVPLSSQNAEEGAQGGHQAAEGAQGGHQAAEGADTHADRHGHRHGHGPGHKHGHRRRPRHVVGGEPAPARGGESPHLKTEGKREVLGVATVEGCDDLNSSLERGLQGMENSTLDQLEAGMYGSWAQVAGVEVESAEQLPLPLEMIVSGQMEQGKGRFKKGKEKYKKGRRHRKRHRHGQKGEKSHMSSDHLGAG
jgi:hypothetical protein